MKFKILNFLFACTILALLGYAGGNGFNYLTTWFKNKPADQIPAPESANQSLTPIVNNATTDLVQQELLNAKWKKEAAEAVVQLNSEFFKIQQEENPNGLKLNLKQLCGLGKHPEFMSLIVSHPELASLLARANDPSAIAKCFEKVKEEEYPILASIFVQFCFMDDSTLAASALNNSRDLVCNLSRRGQINSEMLFMFDHKKPGAQEYSQWLSEVIKNKLSDSSDEEFASFYHLMLIQGPLIRKKMEKDEIFRHKFPSELWPRMVRISNEQKSTMEIYFQLNDQRIWDILALPNGEELVKRLGPIPTNLLYGDEYLKHNPYPKELHDTIIQILLNKHSNEAVISAILEYRDEPNFIKLLNRKLSPESLSATCSKLLKSGPSYSNLLTAYDKLGDKALSDEVGPPPSGVITWVPFYYTLYEVPKKMLQGREPTGMDLFSAIADPAFLVMDVFSAGGATVGRKTLMAGSKAAIEKLGEKGTEKAVVITLRTTGLEIAEKQLSKKVAEKLTDKELVQFTITGLLAQMKSSISSAVGKATTFEITKPLKLLFELSGVSRETWKRMTGLEARIFMRGDARVFVRLGNVPKLMLGTKVVAFLNRSTSDVALGTIVESDPAQDAIKNTAKIAGCIQKITKTEWQQHISAWWLVN